MPRRWLLPSCAPLVLVGAVLVHVGEPGAARGSARLPLSFTDVTASAGIRVRNLCGAPPREKLWLPETMGAGAAWLDYDADGCLDLYVVNGSTVDRPPGKGEPNRLFRGDGRGRFTEVEGAAGAGDRGWGYGVAVGDIDNDGDSDIYVTNLGPNVLFRNEGNGRFTDITARAGVGDASWGSSAAFFDMEGDGDLDLYVGNYFEFDPAKVPARGSKEASGLTTCTERGVPVFCGPLGTQPSQDVLYRNNGDGTFSDATSASGIRLDKPRYALGVVTADYDGDGDADIYVANDSVQNSLWRNDSRGRFEDVGHVTFTAFSATGRPQAGMGTAFGDYNGDGWLDIVVTNFSQDLNTIYQNIGGRFFSDESFALGMGATFMALSWGTGFHDFDHDGDEDLFIANGHIYPQFDDYDLGTTFRQKNHLFLNEKGKFVDVSSKAGPGMAVVRSFRGTAFADYDNDGDLDIFVTALDEEPLLLRNDLNSGGRSLKLRLVGSRSNRDGIGARVTVTSAGRRQIREVQGGGSYLSASDPALHFGLGGAGRAELVEIRWPRGTRQTLRGVAAGGTVVIREPEPAAEEERPRKGENR